MDGSLAPDQLEQARYIHEQTKSLDGFLQDLMTEILLASHEDNRMAIAGDGSIDLSKANYFDVHKSTERVVFGNDLEKGKGEELIKALDAQKELLITRAGDDLDKQINAMLDINSVYADERTWLGETFYQTPMIAALISLSNLQFKIQFLEGELLKELL